MRDHDIKGEPYVECEICGFDYRLSDTTINFEGRRVCLRTCYDDPPQIINSVGKVN